MTTAKEVMKFIKDNDVKYVDFRFTDPRGKWQHVTFDVGMIEEETFAEGQMFDGSSIAGWKAINESDMVLMPDCATSVLDPFAAQTSLIIFCDVFEPGTGQPYARDPRSISKKAEKFFPYLSTRAELVPASLQNEAGIVGAAMMVDGRPCAKVGRAFSPNPRLELV